MFILRCIACISMLCLIFGINNAEIKTAWERNMNISNSEFYFDYQNLCNTLNFNKFAYALCKTSDDKTEKSCNVVIETKGQLDNSCNVTMNVTKTREDYNFQSVQFTQLESNKVVLLWISGVNTTEDIGYGESKVSILDLSSCDFQVLSTHRFKYSPVTYCFATKIIAYDDSTFDVLEYNFDESVFLRHTFNAKSEAILSETRFHYSNHTNYGNNIFTPVTPYSKSQGFLVDYFNEAGLLLVKNNETIVLVNKTTTPNPLELRWMIKLSTSHKTIGYASTFVNLRENSKFSTFIWQFDQEGIPKLNITLNFEYSYVHADIYNLANGEFLLLVIEEISKHSFRPGNDAYHIIKYNAVGERLGALYFGPSEHNTPDSCSTKRLKIFENKSKEYCLYMFCSNSAFYAVGNGLAVTKDFFVNLKVKCFSDQDFSVQ